MINVAAAITKNTKKNLGYTTIRLVIKHSLTLSGKFLLHFIP